MAYTKFFLGPFSSFEETNKAERSATLRPLAPRIKNIYQLPADVLKKVIGIPGAYWLDFDAFYNNEVENLRNVLKRYAKEHLKQLYEWS